MTRLRFNDVSSGNTSNNITLSSPSTTTASFVSAPAFPTIVSPDVAVIVVEPLTANQEIVYVTAFTAGATSATVLRGQEGTTAITHAGTAWLHGPTVLDFALASTSPNAVNAVAVSGAAQTLQAQTMNNITLSANCTLTLPPAIAGSWFTASFVQPASGGPFTPTITGADYGLSGAPTWSTAASKKDLVVGVCDDGATWDVALVATGGF